MGTDLPATRCSSRTDVLEQFFAGHLTAGQLTERLERLRELDAPTAPLPAIAPLRRRRSRRVVSLAALVALGTAAGLAAGVEIASAPQTVAAQTPPTAHTSAP